MQLTEEVKKEFVRQEKDIKHVRRELEKAQEEVVRVNDELTEAKVSDRDLSRET